MSKLQDELIKDGADEVTVSVYMDGFKGTVKEEKQIENNIILYYNEYNGEHVVYIDWNKINKSK